MIPMAQDVAAPEVDHRRLDSVLPTRRRPGTPTGHLASTNANRARAPREHVVLAVGSNLADATAVVLG